MEDVYDGEQVPVLIMIPANTARLVVEARILDDNEEIHSAINTMNTADVMEARVYGEE